MILIVDQYLPSIEKEEYQRMSRSSSFLSDLQLLITRSAGFIAYVPDMSVSQLRTYFLLMRVRIDQRMEAPTSVEDIRAVAETLQYHQSI
jgi:hypothetical protein